MQFGMTNEEEMRCADTETNTPSTSKSFRVQAMHRCTRCAALILAAVVVISLIIAITLILTQTPIDLSQLGVRGKSSSSSERSYKPQVDFHKWTPKPPNYTHLTMEALLMGAGVIAPDHPVTWLPGDKLYMLDAAGNFVLINTSDSRLKSSIVIRKDELKADDRNRGLLMSSDSQLVALSTSTAQVYRHSNRALYEVATVEETKLKNPVSIGPTSIGDEPLQLFEWNPRLGARDVVFVYENNVFYQADITQRGSARPITTSGTKFLYNGVTDWLYEEEIFSSSKAVWWAPSGDYVAYASFDDRQVKRITVPHYESSLVYPRHDEVAYPKAGTPNQPLVSLWFWDKRLDKTLRINPPAEISQGNSSYYLYSAQWVDLQADGFNSDDLSRNEYLLSVWANREQNQVYILPCRNAENCSKTLHVPFHIDGRSMWSEPSELKIQFCSARGYFVLLPRKYTDGNVYNHVAHVSLEMNGNKVTAYYGGSYDVGEIVGYDRKKDEIYFMGAGDSIAGMYLYKVKHASSREDISPECITCNMHNCPSSRAVFAPSGTQFVLYCHQPYKATRTYIKKVEEISKDVTLISDVQIPLQYDAPNMSFEKVAMSNGIDAFVGMLLPPNFDSTSSYPVLLYTYAGPNSNLNSIVTPWDLMSYFSNRRRYVVVTIDARGSSNRGWKVKEQLYKNLGGAEVDDQLEVMGKLLEKHTFLDAQRVAAFGWSYGGFVAAHAAIRNHGATFQCAICVAPVVDFRLYDSAYTERYMGLPSDNPSGYERTNLLTEGLIDNFENVKLMLAHGDADDNVHYQNSALLAFLLQRRGIHFKQLVYTNQDHTIRAAIGHLYMEMDRFLYHDCFGLSRRPL